ADPDRNDFAPGEPLDTLAIPHGQQTCAFLRWDGWPVTSEDFDLYLIGEGDGQVVASSTNDQSASAGAAAGPGTPVEALCYTNLYDDQDFGLAIVRFSAVDSPRLDLYVTGSADLRYATAAGSIVEPGSSPSVLAVGADCWQ